MVMDNIIFEKHNGETVTIVIDGKGYPREVVDNWSSDELAKIRNKLILKRQEDSKNYENSVYDAFRPYIIKAVIRETRRDEKRNLEQMIREMRREDVIAVFTAYFNELLNMTNGDNSKNE